MLAATVGYKSHAKGRKKKKFVISGSSQLPAVGIYFFVVGNSSTAEEGKFYPWQLIRLHGEITLPGTDCSARLRKIRGCPVGGKILNDATAFETTQNLKIE
jgi:hypothetical protein